VWWGCGWGEEAAALTPILFFVCWLVHVVQGGCVGTARSPSQTVWMLFSEPRGGKKVTRRRLRPPLLKVSVGGGWASEPPTSSLLNVSTSNRLGTMVQPDPTPSYPQCA
jgi:hypothetical protein